MSHFTLVFAANFGPPSYCENNMFFSYKTPQKHTPIVLVKSTSFPTFPTWKEVFSKNELIIYKTSRILQLSEFVWTLRSSVIIRF